MICHASMRKAPSGTCQCSIIFIISINKRRTPAAIRHRRIRVPAPPASQGYQGSDHTNRVCSELHDGPFNTRIRDEACYDSRHGRLYLRTLCTCRRRKYRGSLQDPEVARSRRVCLQLLSCKRLWYMVSLADERRECSVKGCPSRIEDIETYYTCTPTGVGAK
jgi:hypothetical protein